MFYTTAGHLRVVYAGFHDNDNVLERLRDTARQQDCRPLRQHRHVPLHCQLDSLLHRLSDSHLQEGIKSIILVY